MLYFIHYEVFKMSKSFRIKEYSWSSLKYLHLRVNRISVLPEKVFSGLSSLRLIRLYGNRISTLSAEVFFGLPSLEGIDLRASLLSFKEKERIRRLLPSVTIYF